MKTELIKFGDREREDDLTRRPCRSHWDRLRRSFIEDPKDPPTLPKIVTFDNVFIIFYFRDYDDRKGYWIENRCHFQRHCNRIQEIISFIFQDSHRDKIRILIRKWGDIEN